MKKMKLNKNQFDKVITFIFNDIDTACVAAIEYVIFMYGNKIWFNAALNKVVTNVYSKTDKEICHIPFIIIKKEFPNNTKVSLSYKGYHYIVNQIEKYNKRYNNNNIV